VGHPDLVWSCISVLRPLAAVTVDSSVKIYTICPDYFSDGKDRRDECSSASPHVGAGVTIVRIDEPATVAVPQLMNYFHARQTILQALPIIPVSRNYSQPVQSSC
jgi:hypothetical protein